jgi:hypothetical protein
MRTTRMYVNMCVDMAMAMPMTCRALAAYRIKRRTNTYSMTKP